MKTSWVSSTLKTKFWDGHASGNYESRMIPARKSNFLADTCSHMILVILLKMAFFTEIICVACVFHFKESMMTSRVSSKTAMHRTPQRLRTKVPLA